MFGLLFALVGYIRRIVEEMEGDIFFHGLLPVSILWDFREFKRDEEPGYGFALAGIEYYGLERITQYVNSGGVDSLELCIIGKKVLLTDGNHRIVAAQRLGHKVIPVMIHILKGDGSDIFFSHTLSQFRIVSKELKTILVEIFERNGYHYKPFEAI